MSAVERWAARIVYLVLAPFVLVGGLLADLHAAMVRVATTVCDAFGRDDPELSGWILVNFSIASVGLALLRFALHGGGA